ncbi:MAG: hypothetical protein E6K56_04195 [Ignavibacteria bacterium]|nr:MAG: hypothetical protein E6K56_04195 [Ignavibacteria bacterium]
MAEKKVGRVTYRYNFSEILELFRLAPETGGRFPDYKAGQYVALSRDNCKLTKKSAGPNGETIYVYDLDESGNPKRGPVTHSYSISSAPFETQDGGYLEFYVVLEMIETGTPGRLSESLFKLDPETDNRITYMNKIAGDFTLDKRAAADRNVVMVGTGTGLAPFASMIKQVNFEAGRSSRSDKLFTLIHANRTREELGYHEELLAIEASKKFDFVYLPSVSRPTPQVLADPSLGKGRANNILRHILGMQLKEEEELRRAVEAGGDSAKAKAALEKTVKPVLPRHLSRELLLKRMDPTQTVIITCGNPDGMADIAQIADANRIRFEKEDW